MPYEDEHFLTLEIKEEEEALARKLRTPKGGNDLVNAIAGETGTFFDSLLDMSADFEEK